MEMIWGVIGGELEFAAIELEFGPANPPCDATDEGSKIGMRSEISLQIIEPQHEIDLGLIGSCDANRRDDAAVVRDVTREAGCIRKGEQIGLPSIGQIAEGAVCYGALRHNCSEGFLDKINRISKLPKMVGLWLSFPASAGEGEFGDS